MIKMSLNIAKGSLNEQPEEHYIKRLKDDEQLRADILQNFRDF